MEWLFWNVLLQIWAILILWKDDEDEDEDDEDGASSIFYNDLYKLDLTTHKWSPLQLRYLF